MTTIIIIILTTALVILCFLYAGIRRSVKEISLFLEEISSGNFDARYFSNKHDRFSGVAKDIVSVMERTKAKLDFAESEMQRMEAILRGLSGGVLITDTHGTILLANRAFKKLFSAHENIEGRQIMEVLRNTQLIDLFRKTMDSWDIFSEEISISKDYRDMHFIATAVPIYTGDSISGTVLTLYDITRLKQLEEMRKDFVANVSHEIKTPITAIKGFTETLLDGAIHERDNALRFLGMIKNHSERLNNLVDDLLTLSRIELGHIEINKTEVDLGEVIDAVFMILKDKAGRKGIYLKKTVPEGLHTAAADKDRLIQIVLNLIDNGIKFTDMGGVTAGVDETGGKLALFVQDTGMGIPQSHMHRLGERFYRVDRARSRELGGTGLGLAIVKHLVHAHNWNMRIESEPGKGTRVNIIIDRYL